MGTRGCSVGWACSTPCVCRYGPRVRMGIYEGQPTSVCPHSTSGRCDYWGPFVNRAARFANAAARGGQILAPAAVGRALIQALTGQHVSLEGGDPVLLAHPDFAPQKLRLQPSKPWVPPAAGHPTRPRWPERRSAEVSCLELPQTSGQAGLLAWACGLRLLPQPSWQAGLLAWAYGLHLLPAPPALMPGVAAPPDPMRL